MVNNILELRIKKIIPKTVRSFFIYFWIPWDIVICIILNFFLLISYKKIISKNEKIIILTEGGYGHTVIDIDISKRLFPSGFTFVILSIPNRHNWQLAKLWRDCEVIHFWLTLKFRSEYKIFAVCFVLYLVFSKIFKKKILRVSEDPVLINYDFYRELSEPDYILEIFREKEADEEKNKTDLASEKHYTSYWARRAFYEPLGSFALPLEIERRFRKRISEHPAFSGKFLGLYMRDKDDDIRCGGDLAEYLPVFQTALRHGYLVLLLGDRTFSNASGHFNQYALEASDFDFERDWYEVAAQILCDRFIGDPGGGIYVPSLLDKPKLMVNSAPYSQGAPGFLHLYKRLTNQKNEIVPIAECFSEHLWKYDWTDEGYKIRNNNFAELQAALDEFFEIPAEVWRNYITDFRIPGISHFSDSGFRLAMVQIPV